MSDDSPAISMVAAIDFGTTYSGYAFSKKDDYETDKLKISYNQWKSPTMISLKTPTTVLLGPDKKLIAFGYDAESQYTALAEQESHKGYYYFRQFKMELYNEIRKSVSVILSITGCISIHSVIKPGHFNKTFKESDCMLCLYYNIWIL